VASPAGGDSRPLGADSQALLSPDGTRVLALGSDGAGTTLTLYRTARRSAPHVIAQLAAGQWSPGSVRLLCWSADSRYVALSANQLSPSGEEDALLVLDVRSGQVRTIATGDFLGARFSPALPDMLVYSEASVAQLDEDESLLYVTSPAGRDTRQLTRSGLASAPAWSAGGIVFAKLLRLGSRSSQPLYALWQIQPSGAGAHRLGIFAAGPPDGSHARAALALSASGKRLVGDFYSPSGAVEVWALTLGRHPEAEPISVPGARITAAGISRNGKSILLTARTPSGQSEIETLPWNGTKLRLLASAATDPSWNH
jgi:hypothetical protein